VTQKVRAQAKQIHVRYATALGIRLATDETRQRFTPRAHAVSTVNPAPIANSS
jgi:hypothetical protein